MVIKVSALMFVFTYLGISVNYAWQVLKKKKIKKYRSHQAEQESEL